MTVRQRHRGPSAAFVLPMILLALVGCGRGTAPAGRCRPAADSKPGTGAPPTLPAPAAPTAGSGAPSLRFYALGDTGTGDGNQAAVAAAMAGIQPAFGAEFVLLLGDNFYERGVRSVRDRRWRSTFEEMYDPELLGIPFYAVLGNHDYRRDPDAQVAYTFASPASRWEMPARYYSFCRELPDGTRVEFFGIDTNTILAEDVQLAWLDTALSASIADWKIVFGHHVLYSYGHYGSDRKLIARLESLFARTGVDLYLAGHEHHLQILEPISGVSYVTSGAGAKTRKPRCGPNTAYAAGALGFVAFEITRDRLEAYVVLADGGVHFTYLVVGTP